MKFVPARAFAIAQKEIFHIRRDPFTLALALGLPLFMVFVFGFAIEFNIKSIHIAVFDSDKTVTSRRVIESFTSSGYFIVDYANSPTQAQGNISREKDRVALIIPSNFETNLFAGREAKAQLLLDGSDNSTVGPVFSYVSSIQRRLNKELAGFDPKSPIVLKTRFLFNHELNSKWFVIPGLIVVVMAILSILLTSLTVAREWENGSMELLLTTPVQPIEIIIGKLAPYGVLGMLAVVLVYGVARTVFQVPFQGNLLTLGLGCAIFLAAYLAQGLLISVIARQQQIAMQMAMISGLLPAQLLSGFVFPIASMPTFFQYFTGILPARWFMNIARETFLEGSTLVEMRQSFIFLTLIAIVMIAVSLKRFKRDLEP
ncbi:MAG: ABC transporter permease [Bdellovibrionia bacterium]